MHLGSSTWRVFASSEAGKGEETKRLVEPKLKCCTGSRGVQVERVNKKRLTS